jgi:hypothetical protein
MKTCKIEGCEKPRKKRNAVCSMHCARKSVHGSYDAIILPSIEERLFNARNIDTITNCWNFTKRLNWAGYGQINWAGKTFRVHRVSAALFLKFDITSKLCVLHKCDNPTCFNPEHLFIGTIKDNVHDSIKKGRSKLLRYGEDCGNSKLTEIQVKEIRQKLLRGQNQYSLAREYNVSQHTIWGIKHHKTWKHID